MSSINDITGDRLLSKPPTDKYRDGWDRIFGNTPKEKVDESATKGKPSKDNMAGR